MKIILTFCFTVFVFANLYSQTITVDTAGVYKINSLYQTPPQYPVDMNSWLDNNIGYYGQQDGEVRASFLIGKDGAVSNIKLLGGVSESSAMGASTKQILIAMLRWKPAMQN